MRMKNLNGIRCRLEEKVDASDYSRIDNAYLTPGTTGWCNGDFDYDGVINGSDCTLIDNASNTQGASMQAPIAPMLVRATVFSRPIPRMEHSSWTSRSV
jgi:hypothetical protein